MKKILAKIKNLTRSKEIQAWRQIEGDKTLRLDYDLDEHSVVFDVGGYEGQWASDIYAKYNCTIHVFEPVKEYADRIRARFEKNPKIIVHNFGLSDKSQKTDFYLADDGSSLFVARGKAVTVDLQSIGDFWKSAGIEKVGLMKINIEGGEYPLLEQLIADGLADKVRYLQIQFHKISAESVAARAAIQEKLRKTHKLSWDYPFVWESWERL